MFFFLLKVHQNAPAARVPGDVVVLDGGSTWCASAG